MIKKFLTFMFVSVFVLAIAGCEEKSDMDKAKDGVKNAWEDTKKAVDDATK